MSKYPDILQKDLDAWIEAQGDPTQAHRLDCLMAELEGSIKACASWGSISQEEADHLLYTYLYERE